MTSLSPGEAQYCAIQCARNIIKRLLQRSVNENIEKSHSNSIFADRGMLCFACITTLTRFFSINEAAAPENQSCDSSWRIECKYGTLSCTTHCDKKYA